VRRSKESEEEKRAGSAVGIRNIMTLLSHLKRRLPGGWMGLNGSMKEMEIQDGSEKDGHNNHIKSGGKG
jgi:hypothetical protein